jgi:hypothetical protein
MTHCRLKETNPGVFAMPVTVLSRARFAKEFVGNQRVMDMPPQWQIDNGYRAFTEATVDKNFVAGAPLDTDDGDTVARTYPSAALKPDADLIAMRLEELARMRWEKEVAGITLNGMFVPTARGDRDVVKAALEDFAIVASGNPMTVPFKVENGTFARIDEATLTVIWQTILLYVQACYTAEEYHTLALQALSGKAILNLDIEHTWPAGPPLFTLLHKR